MKISCLVLASLLFTHQTPEEPPIAAEVGDHGITVAKVERHLKKMLGDDEFDEHVKVRLLSESLEHLIRRHVVLQAVKKDGISVGAGELRMEVEKLRNRLDEIELAMDEYLDSKKLKQSELEYEFRWRLSWQKYLKKHLTEARLEKYFARHRRQFDGTEMHVAHLLLSSLKENTNDRRKRAESVKRQIQEGKIGWEAAVKEHSDAESSADQSGEIGWVTYDGPMPHEFCQMAMKLNVGEISQPVQTVYGMHLIKCLEIRPGKLGAKDAAVELREAAARYLFDSLADQGRESLQVEYKVDWPKPKRKLTIKKDS